MIRKYKNQQLTIKQPELSGEIPEWFGSPQLFFNYIWENKIKQGDYRKWVEQLLAQKAVRRLTGRIGDCALFRFERDGSTRWVLYGLEINELFLWDGRSLHHVDYSNPQGNGFYQDADGNMTLQVFRYTTCFVCDTTQLLHAVSITEGWNPYEDYASDEEENEQTPIPVTRFDLEATRPPASDSQITRESYENLLRIIAEHRLYAETPEHERRMNFSRLPTLDSLRLSAQAGENLRRLLMGNTECSEDDNDSGN